MNSTQPFCGVGAILAIGLVCGPLLAQQRPSPPEPSTRLQINAKPLEIPLVTGASNEPLPSPSKTAGSPMVLEDFEQSALAGHPAIAAIVARINELKWQCHKAGLLPDTRIGYTGQEIGADGTAGFQGGFLSQQIVTGNKLQLDRAVISNDVAALQQQLAAAHQRVITDVRKSFFAVLVAQERVALQLRLVDVARETEQTLKTLYDSGEGQLTDHLQARTELDTQSMSLLASQQAHMSAWRELVTVSNLPSSAVRSVKGNLFEIVPNLDWESIRENLLASSPQVSQAMAIVHREQCAVTRAYAERYPDLTAQVGFVTNNSSGEELVSVQASIPLPRKRRVRAGIGEAKSRLMRAHHVVERIERRLTVQLAKEFQNYEQSRDRIARYREHILPRAKESRELISKAYRLGEMSYVDLLISQRNDFRAQAAFLNEIATYWNSYQRLDGMLLDNALEVPIP